MPELALVSQDSMKFRTKVEAVHGTHASLVMGNKNMTTIDSPKSIEARTLPDEHVRAEKSHLKDLIAYHHNLEGRHTVAALRHEEIAAKKPMQAKFHDKMKRFHQDQALHHFHSKAACLRHLHNLG